MRERYCLDAQLPAAYYRFLLRGAKNASRELVPAVVLDSVRAFRQSFAPRSEFGQFDLVWVVYDVVPQRLPP